MAVRAPETLDDTIERTLWCAATTDTGSDRPDRPPIHSVTGGAMLGKKIPLAKKAAAKPPAKSPSVAAGKKRAEPEEDEPEEERHGASEILAELGSGDAGNDGGSGGPAKRQRGEKS